MLFLFLIQDVQAKHAAEKLMSQLGLVMGDTLPDPSLRLAYRDESHHAHSRSSSEDELSNSEGEQEDEEPEKGGAVVYNIVDWHSEQKYCLCYILSKVQDFWNVTLCLVHKSLHFRGL